MEALSSMPVTQREALLLVGVGELESAEAAAVCGISPQAMRQRISRGRALLAERLSGSDVPGFALLKELKA
jgi:RNA polymerase sigma-70 factor (ECF subfamily)